MNRARLLLGLIVFGGGMVAGAFASQLANPAPPESPWASLGQVGEPPSSHAVALLLVADDAKGLAKTLDVTLLQGLSPAIDPLVDIDQVTFTGATERQGDILAGYVAAGRTQAGEPFLAGIVLRVRDGKVVGVN